MNALKFSDVIWTFSGSYVYHESEFERLGIQEKIYEDKPMFPVCQFGES